MNKDNILNDEKEKQINELALIIAKNCNNVNFDDMYDTAIAIYKAGYRKSEDN